MFAYLYTLITNWIYFVATTLFGFFAFYYFKGDSQSFWIIWIVIPFSFFISEGRFLNRIYFILLLGLALSLLALIAGWIGFNIYIIIIYLIILTYLATYIGQTHPKLFYPTIVFNLLILLAGLQPLPFTKDIERSFFILVGTGIVSLSQLILLPSFVEKRTNWYVLSALKSLRKLTKEIFACFCDPNFAFNVYLFERRIHIQKEKFLACVNKLNHQFESSQIKPNEHLDLVKHLNNLFNNICDLACIRNRIKDLATFELCQTELKEISLQIEAACNVLMENYINAKTHPLNPLTPSIEKLDENYHHVLKVSASDPLIFLIFIASLMALNEKLIDFATWMRSEEKT